MITHLPLDLLNRIDALVHQNIIKGKARNMHSCLVCKKVIKRSYADVRAHFLTKHIDIDRTSN